VTRSYAPGLFHCYDLAGLPRTNNDLEQLFGRWRHQQWRCTGRKVAPASFVVRGSVQIVAAIATQIRLFTADELATVSITAWQSVRTELHHHQHKRINNGIFVVPLIPTLLIWSRNFSSYLCRPRKYLQVMGFNMNQYAVVRHTDRDHDHAHIVASRVRLDGTTVSDSWDYHRSEAAIRQLEQEYGLRSLHSSQTKDSCSPKTGEQRLLARTGEESI
jgi:hypothetical protein